MRTLLLILLLAGASAAPLAAADPLDLSVTPLFLNTAVDPNVMVTVDDSSSMNWGFMPDATLINCFQRRPQMYASNRNLIYFNPNYEYLPPLYGDGTPYPQANFFAARDDGFDPGSPVVNLQTQYRFTLRKSTNPYVASTFVDHQSGATSLSNCDNTWQFPTNSPSAFYCRLIPGEPANQDASYQCQGVPSDERQNFANWYSYYRLRGYSLRTAVTHAFARLDGNIRIGWQALNNFPIVATTKVRRFEANVRQQFHAFVASAQFNGSTPAVTAAIRAGKFFSRSGLNAFSPYYDSNLGMELTCRQNYHLMLSDGYYNDPTWPSGADAAGAILGPLTLPDGKTYDPGDPAASIVGNEQPRQFKCGALLNTLCSPSYSDIAFHYWAHDLRPDLDDDVAKLLTDRKIGVVGPGGALPANPFDNAEVYFNPANDPANWQHLVQFYIAFGIAGTLPQTNEVLTALRKGTTPWPSPVQDTQSALDDAWHGTLVSRGQLFATDNVKQLSDALVDALSTVVRRRGTASPISVSTGILNSDSLSYQTVFDSSDWSGSLLARSIDGQFSSGPVTWDAGCLLTGGECEITGQGNLPTPDWDQDRQIITSSNIVGTGTAFRWNSLSAAQKALLNTDPGSGLDDQLGAKRVAWIRGDRSNEQSQDGPLRDRRSLLGAVVHSGAIYVGAPAAGYDHDWPAFSPEQQAEEQGQGYAKFAETHQERKATLYVGANDGMLHAFDARAGEERFAYIPWAAYPNLAELTEPGAAFVPFVDAAPVIRDAFVGGQWRSLLVGALRRGGQGIFALDVTSPEITEANAAGLVLWEFNQEQDADLGYTYGQPFITRLAHGKWVVLLPAAYNSDDSEIPPVGSGNGVLFVLDASSGALIRKFDLGSQGAGLTSPIAADLDGNDITDYAYAGDLAGHLWRFDFQSEQTVQWSVALFFDPDTPGARPITAQPRLLRDATTGRPRVLVGTGKYLEPEDRTAEIPIQAFYGLLDQGPLPITEDQLRRRSVLDQGNLRKLGDLQGDGTRGWMIEFDSGSAKGERVIATAAVRSVGDTVIFPTLIPRSNDPCKSGTESVLMFVHAANGGPPSASFASFDSNGDGVVNGSDNPQIVGRRIDDLIAGIASVMPAGGGIGAILVPGNDGPQAIIIPEHDWRRRAWRELP